MNDRCPKCDRADCDLPAAEAELLRLLRLPGKRLAREQRAAVAAISDARRRVWSAVVKCQPNAVDWRLRALELQERIDKGIAEANAYLSHRSGLSDFDAGAESAAHGIMSVLKGAK